MESAKESGAAAVPGAAQNPPSPYGPAYPGASRALTDAMLFYLKGAAPWIRFIGILSFVFCGLVVALGFLMMVLSPFMEDFTEYAGAFTGFILGIAYIALGGLSIIPARFMYGFGARLRNYALSNSERELELAFKNNKALWKFLGISSIISLILIPALIIAAVIFVFLNA